MNVKRRGSRADHGLRQIDLTEPRFRWNQTSGLMEAVIDNPARDFATFARHNYIVEFSLNELADMVRALGDDCKQIDSDQFTAVFAKVLPSLIRVTNRAAQAI